MIELHRGIAIAAILQTDAHATEVRGKGFCLDIVVGLV